jgi:hypothetical protein
VKKSCLIGWKRWRSPAGLSELQLLTGRDSATASHFTSFQTPSPHYLMLSQTLTARREGVACLASCLSVPTMWAHQAMWLHRRRQRLFTRCA